jgi:SP family myo-inositol transporter-like MFS transporter 13
VTFVAKNILFSFLGAIIEIKQVFGLSSLWLEVFVSVTIGAAAVSALISGFLCNLIGRRPTLMMASLIFTGGAILLGASRNIAMLVTGRVVVGVGIGMAAMAVPMYIAESAPANVRGKLVVVNVMFITGGQFVATIVDGVFSYLSYDIGWR